MGDIIEIHTVGSNHFALTTDGQVYAWGDGSYGLLANSSGTVVNGTLTGPAVTTPTLISGLSRVRQLAFPDGLALALLADGTVKAWGDDTKLLLGNGTQRRTTRPTTVSSLGNIALMAAVPGNGVRFLRFDGTPLQWGRSNAGTFSPVVVTPAGRVRHVAQRGATFSVLFGNGKVGREFDDTGDVTPAFR
jgi:alpha-tubulin suppressor-like RCC1 family protein